MNASLYRNRLMASSSYSKIICSELPNLVFHLVIRDRVENENDSWAI